jgi:LPXTG-motif cell wall-anchored protein
MSYVLGTHSGHSGLGFIDAATVQKLGSGDKTTALNIFMFGPDQGKSPEERGRRLKEYKLTVPYLIAFEAAKVANGLFGKANNTLTTTQRRTVVNAVTAAFNQAHALAFPAPSGGEVLETASTGDDNTLLYVAGAAGVALLAFGLMRRKK